MNPHVLFLTDNYPPEVNAPASRTSEHCREWARQGCRVTVITCAPNFPKGKVFAGYRNRLWQEELDEGVRVIRVWTYVTANEGFAKRILDYVSFMCSAIVASLFVRRVDVVVGTSPQFFTACAAHVVGTLKRVPWVFELRDIWPESIRAVGAIGSSRLLDALERVELYLYARATTIVSVTNAFRTALVSRGVSGTKICVVTNGVDSSRFHPREKDEELLRRLGLAGKFVAGYIGTHGLAHALDTVLDAAALSLKTPGAEDFRFLLLGDGAQKQTLARRVRDEGLSNVVMVDSVPKDDVARYWSVLDVSIIHLKRTPLFTTVIPSKLFECMGMGVPILHGVEGESAEIVEREGVGLTFQPENAAELVDAMRRLFADSELLAGLQAAGPRVAKKYDRSALATQMLGILRTVASRQPLSQSATM